MPRLAPLIGGQQRGCTCWWGIEFSRFRAQNSGKRENGFHPPLTNYREIQPPLKTGDIAGNLSHGVESPGNIPSSVKKSYLALSLAGVTENDCFMTCFPELEKCKEL